MQERLGRLLVGSRNEYALQRNRFPLLIKLLDANQWLSVQVHPNDQYALTHEGDFGKTEMWVVLHAEAGAELIYGFKKGVSREDFIQAVNEGRSADTLYRLAVRKNDVIFVPAGAIHALGPGIIVAEIQQNSDTTYRIYDWGRPRPLHINKALEVLDFSLVEPQVRRPVLLHDGTVRHEEIGVCPYFQTERLTMATESHYGGACNGDTFEIWGVLEGQATVEWSGAPLRLAAVAWTLLPAALGEFSIRAHESSTLLRVFTPAARKQ